MIYVVCCSYSVMMNTRELPLLKSENLKNQFLNFYTGSFTTFSSQKNHISGQKKAYINACFFLDSQ